MARWKSAWKWRVSCRDRRAARKPGLRRPAAEVGDGGPLVGGRAGGGFAEGAEEKRLGSGGALDVRHKCLLWRELTLFQVFICLMKAPPFSPLFHPILPPVSRLDLPRPRLRLPKIAPLRRRGIWVDTVHCCLLVRFVR